MLKNYPGGAKAGTRPRTTACPLSGARENSHRRLETTLGREERKQLRDLEWRHALHEALRASGRNASELVVAPAAAPWKIAVAAQLREQVAAPYAWLARALCLGLPATLRARAWRHRAAQCATARSRPVPFFVTSANFTEAAQQRSIELGVLCALPHLAERVCVYFEGLRSTGQLRRLP